MLNGGNAGLQLFGRAGLGFGQYGGEARRIGDFSFILYVYRVVYGRQAFVVQQLCTLHNPLFLRIGQFLHSYYCTACLADVRKVNHCAGLIGVVVLGAHGYLREEGQGTFAAYHQVGDDVEWVIEADEGQEVEACDILDGIFVTDALQ